jgi:hypothetical protein
VIVPRAPTDAMLDAGAMAHTFEGDIGFTAAKYCWENMLSALSDKEG